MRHRLRYMRNAPDGNGSLARGDFYQVPMDGLLGGATGHRIWEVKTTPQYSLGTRLVYSDGRVFRYAKAGGTLITSYGCENSLQSAIARTSLTYSAAIGAKSVTFDTAVTDGICINGAGTTTAGLFSKDELVGGFIVIEKVIGNVDNCETRRITGNSAVTAIGSITVTFDDPLAVAVDTDEYACCMFSPYQNVQSSSYGNAQAVGVPCMIATVGQYLWIQTWGPCWVTTQPRVNTQLYDGQVVFRHDGTVDIQNDGEAIVQYAQHAGFVLSNAQGGHHSQGGAFIMLQICP